MRNYHCARSGLRMPRRAFSITPKYRDSAMQWGPEVGAAVVVRACVDNVSPAAPTTSVAGEETACQLDVHGADERSRGLWRHVPPVSEPWSKHITVTPRSAAAVRHHAEGGLCGEAHAPRRRTHPERKCVRGRGKGDAGERVDSSRRLGYGAATVFIVLSAGASLCHSGPIPTADVRQEGRRQG